MRALILAPFSTAELAELRETIDVTYESWLETRRLYDPEELGSRLTSEGTAILVVESDFVFEEVFDQAPSLRFVGVCRNATEHIDIEAATRHGVLVVNTPGRNARAVAEQALGLMLALARQIPQAHCFVTDGRWQNPAEPYISMRGVELGGRTLGIVGLGAVGRTLASIASCLGMRVLTYDPYLHAVPPGVRLTDLDDLLAESDFVAIHAPLTPETEALIDGRGIARMRPTSYLVNLSAAAIVSQDALVGALRDGRIAGAALDMFETHPVSPGNPLLSMDNVVLTPHLGGTTEETIERHSKTMASDIRRYVAGERPVNLVNPEAWPDDG